MGTAIAAQLDTPARQLRLALEDPKPAVEHSRRAQQAYDTLTARVPTRFAEAWSAIGERKSAIGFCAAAGALIFGGMTAALGGPLWVVGSVLLVGALGGGAPPTMINGILGFVAPTHPGKVHAAKLEACKAIAAELACNMNTAAGASLVQAIVREYPTPTVHVVLTPDTVRAGKSAEALSALTGSLSPESKKLLPFVTLDTDGSACARAIAAAGLMVVSKSVVAAEVLSDCINANLWRVEPSTRDKIKLVEATGLRCLPDQHPTVEISVAEPKKLSVAQAKAIQSAIADALPSDVAALFSRVRWKIPGAPVPPGVISRATSAAFSWAPRHLNLSR